MSCHSAAMDEITIRPAQPDDWPTIVESNCRLAEESEGKRLDRATLQAGVRAVLADPNRGRYFLACADGRIVGQLMTTWEWSDWRNGRIWWLQSVYVHPDYRRRGVFRRLFEHVLRAAESDPGVVGLRLYVENGNERAQETYRSLGMSGAGYFVLERMFGADTGDMP